MRLCNSILLLLCSCSSILAQKPLAIGDSVPTVRLTDLVNHSAPSAALSDFKGKLVIIDFWATWCTSCLHAFGKMDSLQTAFGDKVKIILVNTKSTGDNLSKIQTFFQKWESRTGRPLSLPTVINDTALEKLFPHKLIPHYVWINREGKLIAISSSDAVTAANLQSAYNGEALLFTMKKDQEAARPVFSTADLPGDKLLNYCVFIKEWFDGLPSGNRLREKDDVICGKAMTNTSLLDMFIAAATGIDPSFTGKRLALSTGDSSDLLPPPEMEEREAWYKQHAFTLDLLVPAEEANDLYPRMLEVLNNYSGYVGSFQKRKRNCWVLVKKNALDRIKSKGKETVNNLWEKESPYLQNGTMDLLVQRLNTLSLIKEPVLNETAYEGKIDIHFLEGLDNIKTIQKQLGRYGLALDQQQRVLNVLVIQKKENSN